METSPATGKTETIMIKQQGKPVPARQQRPPRLEKLRFLCSSGNYIETKLAGDQFPQPVDNEGYRFAPTQIQDL